MFLSIVLLDNVLVWTSSTPSLTFQLTKGLLHLAHRGRRFRRVCAAEKHSAGNMKTAFSEQLASVNIVEMN